MRAQIETAIEALIALLDAIDPDPDLEPSIGGDDREAEDEREPDVDGEPWLGWTASGAIGNIEDLEENGDEGDYSGHEDEGWTGRWDAGGVVIANELLRNR